jgi:tRNA threonylcarbamoyladenosine biosynthesis protein TsaB
VLILALETSSQAGSVALLDRDTVLSERRLRADRRSAQTLAPTIADALAEARRKPQDVRLVAVTIGPGSFTGLRVGVTTAKTFAYAVGAEVLGMDTLEVIASQSDAAEPRGGRSASRIEAVIDAQRKELFWGRFIKDSSELTRVDENRIVPVDQWLAELRAGAIVTGTGIQRILDRLPADVAVAAEVLREPQAVTVGQLAWKQYDRGRRDDLWKLSPKYLRASAAEEKAK